MYMVGVNLIPVELLRRRTLRRRIRAWSAAALVLAVVVVVPLVTERRRDAQADRLLNELAELDAKLTQARVEVSTTAETVLDLDAELARADALKAKRSWCGLLRLVARCMPDELWLTSLATDLTPPSGPVAHSARRDGLARGRGDETGDAAAPAEVVLAAPTRLRIEGYALDHEGLYSLMSGLNGSGSFASVRMERSGVEPVLNGQAVRFVLVCDW